MQREMLAAAEHFLRRAQDLLPVVTLEEWSQGAWQSPNDALRALCRAWRRLLDEALLRPLEPHFKPPLYEAWQALQSCMPDTEMALGGPKPIDFLPDDLDSV